MPYIREVCKCGKIIEVNKYFSTRYQKKGIPSSDYIDSEDNELRESSYGFPYSIGPSSQVRSSKASSSGGGSSKSTKGKTTGTSKKTNPSPIVEDNGGSDDTIRDMSNYEVSNGHGESWIEVKNLGRLSYVELEDMLKNGTVVEKPDHRTKTIRYVKK